MCLFTYSPPPFSIENDKWTDSVHIFFTCCILYVINTERPYNEKNRFKVSLVENGKSLINAAFHG